MSEFLGAGALAQPGLLGPGTALGGAYGDLSGLLDQGQLRRDMLLAMLGQMGQGLASAGTERGSLWRGLAAGMGGAPAAAMQARSGAIRDAMAGRAIRREADWRQAFGDTPDDRLTPGARTLRQGAPAELRGVLGQMGPTAGAAALAPHLLEERRNREAAEFWRGGNAGTGGATAAGAATGAGSEALPRTPLGSGALPRTPLGGAATGAAALPAVNPLGPGAATAPGGGAQPPAALMPAFEQASRETGIPVPILVAQARQESGFNPAARGRAGEIGIMQIKPGTARDPGYGMAGVDPAALADPATNIRFGARYLAARGQAAGVRDWSDPAQVDRALGEYNGGGDPNYVANVRRHMPGNTGTAGAGASGTQSVPQPTRTADGGGLQLPDGRSFSRQDILRGMMHPNPQVRAQATALAQLMNRDDPLSEVADPSSPTGRRLLPRTQASGMPAPGPTPDHALAEVADPDSPTGRRLLPRAQAAGRPAPGPNNGPPSGYEPDPERPGALRPIAGGPQDPAGQGFTRAGTLRGEFTRLTEDFRTIQTAWTNIQSAARSQNGAGDMSMLYSFVKLLDPTSVVRESEFATAAASGSFGERVQGAAQRVISGERLPDSLRDSFLAEARNIFQGQRRTFDRTAETYADLARRNGLDPANVVLPFAAPGEPSAAQTPGGGAGTGGAPGGGAGLPRVATPAEAQRLPPGTRFLDPNGVERVRP